MSSIVVVGSMAFDTIETPFGKKDKILGDPQTIFPYPLPNLFL